MVSRIVVVVTAVFVVGLASPAFAHSMSAWKSGGGAKILDLSDKPLFKSMLVMGIKAMSSYKGEYKPGNRYAYAYGKYKESKGDYTYEGGKGDYTHEGGKYDYSHTEGGGCDYAYKSGEGVCEKPPDRPGPSVPEPAAGVLFPLGALLVLRRLRSTPKA